MSLYVKGGGGITKLSELIIDADKDWQAKGITNLKEVAAAMAKGDLPVRGNAILQRLIPGAIGLVLTSAGPGHIPFWAPCAGALERYIAAWIELSHAEAIVTVDQSHNEDAPITSSHVQAYEDAPADMIKRLTPAITCPDSEDIIVTPDQIHNKDAPIASEGGGQLLVGGAVADDGGVQTDETAAARDATANDMTLLPATPAVDDAYYFGLGRTWDRLWLNVGQAGVGDWGLAYEYWNGSAWSALSSVVDKTSEFTVAGTNKIQFTRPGDWALTTIQTMNLYWIRTRVSAYTSITTQPLGTQAWCEVIA